MVSCVLELAGKEGRWRLVSVYAPTFRAEEEKIAGVWAAPRGALGPSSKPVFALGDFNSRVGSRAPSQDGGLAAAVGLEPSDDPVI